MKSSALVGPVVTFLCFGHAAPLFAAEPVFTGTATQVAPGDKVVVLATDPPVGKPIARSQPTASVDRYVQMVSVAVDSRDQIPMRFVARG